MSVKRYEVEIVPYEGGSICEDPYGEYVLYTDYAALEQRFKALEKEASGKWIEVL